MMNKTLESSAVNAYADEEYLRVHPLPGGGLPVHDVLSLAAPVVPCLPQELHGGRWLEAAKEEGYLYGKYSCRLWDF